MKIKQVFIKKSPPYRQYDDKTVILYYLKEKFKNTSLQLLYIRSIFIRSAYTKD